MRFRLALVALLLLAGAVQLPLAVVARQMPGSGAAAVRGSVWNGRMDAAVLGDFFGGDTRVALAPLPLLIGRRQVALQGAGWRATLHRGSGVIGGATGIADASGRLPLLPGRPLAAVTLSGVTMMFEDGRCRTASGGISAEIAGVAQALQGALRCEGAVARLSLAGGSTLLDLRFAGDGNWRGTLTAGGIAQPLAGAL